MTPKMVKKRQFEGIGLPAGANVAQAYGHDAQACAKYQCR